LEILKLILSVAIASLMLCSFAYGGTPPPSSQLGSSGAVQIKQGKDRDNWQRRGDGDWRDREASRYGPNDRYRGWHRYAYRPNDWGDRGCIAVSPSLRLS
jgi:hypothetical protein